MRCGMSAGLLEKLFVEIVAYVPFQFLMPIVPHKHPSPQKTAPNHQKHAFRPKTLQEATLAHHTLNKVHRYKGGDQRVHNLVTSAMYLRTISCKSGDAPLAPSAIWDPCCGGAQASEQDFGDNIDRNQWDITWN